MKSGTVKLMSVEQLLAASIDLIESIPKDQAALALIQQELRERQRASKQVKGSGSLWGSERPEFMERIGKLAGGTTYRTPNESKGTKFDQLPDAHAIAAALAFGRRGPDDVGPDVAYCWALQTDAFRNKVTRKLAVALQCHEFRSVAPLRLTAAEAAWDALIWNRASARPGNAPPAYDQMLLAACGTLETSAWDSLAEAERSYLKKTD